MQQKLRIEGSIYGHLIGNAIGIRCQNIERKRSIISQQLASKYADAGAMSLCTMSSLLDSDRIDTEDIADRLNEWYIGSYLSSQTIQGRVSISQSIRMYTNGMPPDRCGSTNKISDNSALMRMLPIALWNADESISKIVIDAHETTKFTNRQVDAQVYSALYCLMIRSFLHQQKDKITHILSSFYSDKNMDTYKKTLDGIKKTFSSNPEPMGSDEVGDSFWSSIQINNKHDTDFEETITESVLLGNDCSVTSAITGSLTGISLGINEIPQRWLNQLEMSSDATMIVDNFIKKANAPK